ncbi:hypothetical protein [Schaalia suimastitidis]|uniref:hypothetical protein n=1 Tax=Schaalia suimastitidis TaxID=121163 RepID=UPI00047DC4B1|nr:hypothetical protein [Schaalia suimastitidis]
MTNSDWTRIEGMIIGTELDPHDVAEYLRGKEILAQLEWFASSPQLLGLCVAVTSEEDIASLPPRHKIPKAGPKVADLVAELAAHYQAEVRLGTHLADHLPEGVTPALLGDHDADAEEAVSRIVEIGRTPSSSVPLLAALEGIDLASLELADGHRALLAELPPNKAGWNFGELPLVTLAVTNGQLQGFLVTDDHLEHVVSYNWGLDKIVVTGAVKAEDSLDPEVVDLVGDGKDLDAIAAAVPGAKADALRGAATASGKMAVRRAVAALGLPKQVADFLLGQAELDEVEGASVHLARGISTAIGRSVDIMLGASEKAVHPSLKAYRALALDRPWIVRTGASIEAALGAGLVVLAARSKAPRSPWAIAGGILGGLMVVDSIAELFLAKYVASRTQQD